MAKKDAIAHGKVGIAEAKKEAIIQAIQEASTFIENRESITWQEFISLDIIGDKQKRLKIYDMFHLGYGNAKTLFKRLNMAGITKEMIDEGLNQIDIKLEREILIDIFNYFYDKTFIVVSHRRDNIDLYDRIIKMSNGKVKEMEERLR